MISEENKQHFQNEKYLFQTEALCLGDKEICVDEPDDEGSAVDEEDERTDVVCDARCEERAQEIPDRI